MDKNNPNDPGFTLTLSQRTEYDQMVKAAAKHLEVDPTYLQFFKTQSYREAPGHALRCTYDGTLKDLLVYFRPKQPKKMFYQKLAIPIHELENKKQIKCTYLSTDQVNFCLVWLLYHHQGISPIAKIAIAILIFIKFGIAIAILIAIWKKIADLLGDLFSYYQKDFFFCFHIKMPTNNNYNMLRKDWGHIIISEITNLIVYLKILENW